MVSNGTTSIGHGKRRSERGTAMLEAAVTLPILLLIAVGIFEFGRAYQTWQVLTNAAREGARISVLPGSTDSGVQTRARDYMTSGQLSNAGSATINVNRNATILINGANASASEVTVQYPFDVIVLQPVARLINRNSQTGSSLTMVASAVMRNEGQ